MRSELPAVPGTTRMPEHRVAVSERGSFAFATCTCGWYSAARRSRDLARREGAGHLAECGAGEPD